MLLCYAMYSSEMNLNIILLKYFFMTFKNTLGQSNQKNFFHNLIGKIRFLRYYRKI